MTNLSGPPCVRKASHRHQMKRATASPHMAHGKHPFPQMRTSGTICATANAIVKEKQRQRQRRHEKRQAEEDHSKEFEVVLKQLRQIGQKREMANQVSETPTDPEDEYRRKQQHRCRETKKKYAVQYMYRNTASCRSIPGRPPQIKEYADLSIDQHDLEYAPTPSLTTEPASLSEFPSLVPPFANTELPASGLKSSSKQLPRPPSPQSASESEDSHCSQSDEFWSNCKEFTENSPSSLSELPLISNLFTSTLPIPNKSHNVVQGCLPPPTHTVVQGIHLPKEEAKARLLQHRASVKRQQRTRSLGYLCVQQQAITHLDHSIYASTGIPAEEERCYSISRNEGADAESGTPWPSNPVFSTDSRRQLITASVANQPALAAILFLVFCPGARRQSSPPQLTASPAQLVCEGQNIKKIYHEFGGFEHIMMCKIEYQIKTKMSQFFFMIKSP